MSKKTVVFAEETLCANPDRFLCGRVWSFLPLVFSLRLLLCLTYDVFSFLSDIRCPAWQPAVSCSACVRCSVRTYRWLNWPVRWNVPLVHHLCIILPLLVWMTCCFWLAGAQTGQAAAPGASNLSVHCCYITGRYCAVTHRWAEPTQTTVHGSADTSAAVGWGGGSIEEAAKNSCLFFFE